MALYLVPGAATEGGVKSVQRGTFSNSSVGAFTAININTVNPLKCIAIIDSGCQITSNNQANWTSYPPYLTGITASTLTITNSVVNANGSYSAQTSSWQLIEYV